MEFLKIWEILLRRKRIIVAIFLGFFLATVVGTHLIVPVYKAQAKILIDPPNALKWLMSNLGLNGLVKQATSSSNQYDTDIELAQIQPIRTMVCRNLYQFVCLLASFGWSFLSVFPPRRAYEFFIRLRTFFVRENTWVLR